ncbi:unnamed protein product [Chrysoparadoxa australica]
MKLLFCLAALVCDADAYLGPSATFAPPAAVPARSLTQCMPGTGSLHSVRSATAMKAQAVAHPYGGQGKAINFQRVSPSRDVNTLAQQSSKAISKDSSPLFADSELMDQEDRDDEKPIKLRWGSRWVKRVKAVLRTMKIWGFLFVVLLKLGALRLAGNEDEESRSHRARALAKFLCSGFLKLGPTFIKVGQLLSTRIDILSKEYIEELRQLQDNVPGFGGPAAIQIVEEELGAPIDELFDSFDEQHIAAASLGQVHEAFINGTRFAVKVQRPGLRELFEVDLKSIGLVATLLDVFDPKLDGTSKDWGSIFSESKRVLYEEISYYQEADNCERFGDNFRDCDWVKAPYVNRERSTDKVLCMEYLEGIKISDVDEIEAAGLDRELLATRTAECYLTQLIRHGFFHCDPHPGNLFVDGKHGGRVIFFDFGMMDNVPLQIKRSLVDLIFGVYETDVKTVCDALEDMDIIRRGADRMTLERVARFYLTEFESTLKAGPKSKWINELDAEEEKQLRRRERAKIGQELFSMRSDVPLQFPASFTFVFRAFTTLDGIGKTLSPAYDLTRIAQPYLKELLDLRDGNVYTSIAKSFAKRLGLRQEDLYQVVTQPRRVAHIEDVTTKLAIGDLKLRVRNVETEQELTQIQAVQDSLGNALMATLFCQIGMLLCFISPAASSTAFAISRPSQVLFALSGVCGLRIPIGYFKVFRMKQLKSVRCFFVDIN